MTNRSFIAASAGAFVLSAMAGWWITTWATPRVIQTATMERIAALAGGANKMLHAPPPGPQSREVVRPSPDLLYSLCAYDVSSGDVFVRLGATDGYWSVSAYDVATNNFHIASHRDHRADGYAFRLTRASASNNGQTVVRSPTDRGVLLIRRRIADEASLSSKQQAQKQDACGVVEGS